MNLTIRETEALDALCDAFVPSLAFEKDEDPALFSMSARDLGVAALVAEALERIEPAKRDAFRLFLKLLENPLFIATVSANATRFSRVCPRRCANACCSGSLEARSPSSAQHFRARGAW